MIINSLMTLKTYTFVLDAVLMSEIYFLNLHRSICTILKHLFTFMFITIMLLSTFDVSLTGFVNIKFLYSLAYEVDYFWYLIVSKRLTAHF
jgi:hypothetical protein